MGSRIGLQVLLLEDDDADAYLTKRALLSSPRVADVVRAQNGQEAIQLLANLDFSPDIAFVDLQMPTMDGLSFLEKCFTDSRANIPFVVLTSSSDWKDATRSRVNGALLVIVKPESPAELARILAETLDKLIPDPSDATRGTGRKVFDLPTSSAPVYAAPRQGCRVFRDWTNAAASKSLQSTQPRPKGISTPRFTDWKTGYGASFIMVMLHHGHAPILRPR